MRIAIDASILELPCPTGVERAAAETLRALPASLKSGDELIVFGRAIPPLPGPPSRAVRTVGLGGREPLAVWRETRLAPALGAQEADVLWSPVAAIPLHTLVPRVATVHELPWLVRPGLEGRVRERVHRARLRFAARTAALVCVPSQTTAAQVIAEVPDAAERVRVLPHAVAPRFLVPADPVAATAVRAFHDVAPAPFLLHVGGTRARKGVPLLLRAYARYRLQGGTAPLVLAGPGEAPARMPPGAQHLGYVSDDLLVALYAGASILVVSSESEGFGLPCIEAMALGVPVVTVGGGALPEVVGDAALVVPYGDDDALAAGVLRVEHNRDLAATLIESGRARAASLSWATTATRLREILAEAVKRRGRAMSAARVTIAFNCTAYDDLPSGARVRAVGLAAGLLAEGAGVHLYTARGKTLAPDVEAELGAALPADRFEETSTSLEPFAPAVRAARSGRWFHRHLAPADLFVTDYYPVVDHVPTALTIHDLRYLASPADEPRQRVLWFRTFYARMAARAPYIVVPSAAIGSEVAFHLGIHPARIAVVRNGLSSALLAAPSDAMERTHLLWVGTPEHRKRLRFLLRAYALAAETASLLPLVLVGRGAVTAELPEEADPLIARGLVRAEGVVSSARLIALLRSAVALLHPSRYEGFGMPVAEALALGTPVIAARISAIEEVAEGGAVLLAPDHLDAWQAAIAAAGGSGRNVDQPPQAAIERVRAASWNAAARALLAITDPA